MIDSHCHLNYYPDTYDDIIKRAQEAGVKGLLTVNTKLDEAPFLQKITREHSNIWMSVGVHPHEADPHCKVLLRSFLEDPKVVALGETGLDYYHEKSNQEAQIKSFEVHLETAQETHLPVIVHTRSADQDTIVCLDRYPEAKGVLHCFTGSYAFAKQALDRGFVLSFSGIITFKNALDICEVIKKIPLDSLLIETDSPYLAPIPHRGQKNEPAFVQYVALKIAELKGVSVEEVIDATTHTFFKVFSKAHLS